MATLADIAKLVGVNKTTVSKALNNSTDIRKDTRDRIVQAAAQLGYARHPRRRTDGGGFVGVVCPEVKSYYYGLMVSALDARLREKGYDMVLMLSNFEEGLEKQHLMKLVRMRAAGIICVTERSDSSTAIEAAMEGWRVPVVVMGLNYESVAHDVISINEKSAIRALVDHLVRRGRERVAFIGERLVQNRLIFFREAMQAAGRGVPEEYVVLSEERGAPCGYAGARALMALDPPPDAIFAGYDIIGLGVYRALCEMGVKVPEDVALVGFDDSDFCPYLPVSMSSVNCDVEAECRVAVAVLLSKVRDPGLDSNQVASIIPKLAVRESSGGRA